MTTMTNLNTELQARVAAAGLSTYVANAILSNDVTPAMLDNAAIAYLERWYWDAHYDIMEAEEAEEEDELEPLNAVRIGEIADLLDMDAAEVAAFCHADWGDPNHRAWLHTSTNKQIATWILACTYTM